MKKVVLLIILFILVIAFGCISICVAISNKQLDKAEVTDGMTPANALAHIDVQRVTDSVSIESYKIYIDNFSLNIHVGAIEDSHKAIEKAYSLWDEKDLIDSDEEDGKITVAYCVQEDCWIIRYSPGLVISEGRDAMVGGGIGTIIRSDGQVLALWLGD